MNYPRFFFIKWGCNQMALYHECSVSRQHRQIPMAGLGEVKRSLRYIIVSGSVKGWIQDFTPLLYPCRQSFLLSSAVLYDARICV